MMRLRTSMAAAALLAISLSQADASLITNGNFETGSFAGWTVVNLPGNGDWFIDTPGSTTPLSTQTTLGSAANGNWYAVTDQTGPGTHVLLQSFVAGATSVTVSWDMFVNDQSGTGPIINPAGLDHNAGPNQHARVDVLTAAATAFSTAGGDVVSNLYTGIDLGPNPHAFTAYSFVVGGLTIGSTYQLRFAEVDNQFFLNMGIDNISVENNAEIPEPASLTLLGLGAIGLIAGPMRRRRRQAT